MKKKYCTYSFTLVNKKIRSFVRSFFLSLSLSLSLSVYILPAPPPPPPPSVSLTQTAECRVAVVRVCGDGKPLSVIVSRSVADIL